MKLFLMNKHFFGFNLFAFIGEVSSRERWILKISPCAGSRLYPTSVDGHTQAISAAHTPYQCSAVGG